MREPVMINRWRIAVTTLLAELCERNLPRRAPDRDVGASARISASDHGPTFSGN